MVLSVFLVASFFSSLYYFFGSGVTWMTFLIYMALPPIFLHEKFICYFLFMNKIRTPFLNLKSVKKFGINGGRYLMLKLNSTVDKQEVEIMAWHILPKSLVEKSNSLGDDPEEIDRFFDDQLRHSQQPIIVYSHGITQTVAEPHRVALYKILQQMDMHVVAFDYRGFGDSTNIMPTKLGAVEDFLTVYSWVKEHSGDSPVFVWGHSLGSSLSLKSFSKLEEYGSTLLNLEKPLAFPQGFILESGFSKNADCVEHFKPASFLLILPYYKKYAYKRFATDRNVALDSTKYVAAVKHVPILIMHSRDDGIIPYTIGELLYKAAAESRTEKDPPAKFVLFSKGGHMWLCNEENLATNVRDFVDLYKKSV